MPTCICAQLVTKCACKHMQTAEAISMVYSHWTQVHVCMLHMYHLLEFLKPVMPIMDKPIFAYAMETFPKTYAMKS